MAGKLFLKRFPEHVDAALAASDMGPLPADALGKLEPLYETDFGRA